MTRDRTNPPLHFVLAAVIAGCAGAADIAPTPAVSQTVAPTPASTAPPVPTSTAKRSLEPRPSLPPLVNGEADACIPGCASGIVDAGFALSRGVYQTQWFFGGAFTIEVGEGWKLREDSTGEFGLTPQDDPLEYGIVFWLDPYVLQRGDQVNSPLTAAGFLGALEQHPDLVVSTPAEAAIGAFPARSVDIQVAEDAVNSDPGCPIDVCVEFISYPEWTVPFGMGKTDDVYRFVVADVTYSGSSHLFVAAIEGQNREFLDAFVVELAPMIASVQIPAHPR